MSSPIDLVLARLEPYGLRENGRDRWRACCPAHGGKNSSTLSVGIGGDDAVLLKCWSGCEVEQVVQALGLELHDLFPAKVANGHGAPPLKRRHLITASQALELLDHVGTFYVVVHAQLARGEPLDKATHELLLRSAARVAYLCREVNA